MIVYVDGDACPVKDEVYRIALKNDLKVYVACHSSVRAPAKGRVEVVRVKAGLNAADDWIAERAGEGDVVVTSGADGIYPRGFRIGSVEHSERGEGLSLTITVRPTVDFRALDEVLVVLREARGAISEGASEPGGQAR